MKILLTGATGFIGAHVVKLLVGEGCEIYALVRDQSNFWRIESVVSQLHLVHCNLLNSDQLNAHLAAIRPDLCLHLAWYVVPGQYESASENLAWLNATLSLASRLADLGCKRFVGIGTCAEYDTELGYLSETSSTKPRNLYAASKLATQLVLSQLSTITGMEVVWPRLFYQYGPFEKQQRLVPAVIYSLLRNQVAKVTEGEQIRDFLYIEDVAEAIWAIAQSKLCGPVNVGSGQPVALRDMVTKIGHMIGRPELIALGALSYSATEPMFICANNRRLIENTTWSPQYHLERGLQNTIEWWRRRFLEEY